MATSLMYRTGLIVTGVAGSPFYIRGYWDSTAIGAQDAALQWKALFAQDATVVPNGWTVNHEAEVAGIVPATGEQVLAEQVSVPGVTGTNPGTVQPHQVQILFRWRTNDFHNGRRVQGRSNNPFTYVAEVGPGGGLTGPVETGWQGKLNSFLATADGAFRVWSRSAGEHFQVTGSDVWSQFAVLRSRRD